jgi:hypothetical protein
MCQSVVFDLDFASRGYENWSEFRRPGDVCVFGCASSVVRVVSAVLMGFLWGNVTNFKKQKPIHSKLRDS